MFLLLLMMLIKSLTEKVTALKQRIPGDLDQLKFIFEAVDG